MSIIESLTQYATLLTVLVGVVFGTLSVRQWQRTRYLTAAVELVESIQTIEFTRSLVIVMELPERADPDILLGDREIMTAASVVNHVFEGLGLLVFARLLPLHLVDHLTGGALRASWIRLKPHIEERRASLGTMTGEWYQWLAERVLETPAPGKEIGAALAHRHWRA